MLPLLRGSRSRSSLPRLRLAAISLAILLRPVPAISAHFEKVVDTRTTIPGRSQTFVAFGPPAIADGVVVFEGFESTGTGGSAGLYRSVGGRLEIVADDQTPLPNAPGPAAVFNTFTVDGEHITFRGPNGFISQDGIYSTRSGVLAPVADRTTRIPGTSTTLLNFLSDLSASGSAVAFVALGLPGEWTLFLDDGRSLKTVADLRTIAPDGGGTFRFFEGLTMDAGQLIFIGTTSRGKSLFRVPTNDPRAISLLFRTGDRIPGTDQTFLGFSTQMSLDGGQLLFDGGDGLMVTDGVNSRQIANKQTQLPGGVGLLRTFCGVLSSPALDAGRVVFCALSERSLGIYASVGDHLVRIADRSDSIDGKTPELFRVGRDSISGSQIAFQVTFKDFSQAIYVTTLNEPPVADAGPDRVVECESPEGASVVLDGSGSRDPDGAIAAYRWSHALGVAEGEQTSVQLPLGDHQIELEVEDDLGATNRDDVQIKVLDTAPPVIDRIRLDPAVLWPPNHRLVPVAVDVDAHDRCSLETSCRVLEVGSSEPERTGRGGPPETDALIVGDLGLLLRAESSGARQGRSYSVTVECTDATGNSAVANAEVVVPHDRRRGKR